MKLYTVGFEQGHITRPYRKILATLTNDNNGVGADLQLLLGNCPLRLFVDSGDSGSPRISLATECLNLIKAGQLGRKMLILTIKRRPVTKICPSGIVPQNRPMRVI